MLPDYRQRNELKFKVLRDVPYNVRIWLVLGLWAAGLLIQALGWLLPGLAVIFFGTIIALVRGYSNEPGREPTGKKRWENVTLDEFKRIMTLDQESHRWDRSAWIDATNRWGCLTGLLFTGAVVAATARLWHESARLASVCAFDGAALFAPFWLSGIRRLYHRTELMIRVGALQNILDRLSEPDARGMMATPMLELQETKEGDVPQDVKLMVRFDDAPDNFLGIQVQVSLNDVQGTKYPYLYCVILAKPGFGLGRWDCSLVDGVGRMTTERKTTDEVELLVVRQATTRNSGYHTNRAAQRRVFDGAVQTVRCNLVSHS